MRVHLRHSGPLHGLAPQHGGPSAEVTPDGERPGGGLVVWRRSLLDSGLKGENNNKIII